MWSGSTSCFPLSQPRTIRSPPLRDCARRPWLRALGYYTHVTLHHIIEHVDFAGAGVRQERMFRLGSDLATRTLLKANSVSVLLSGYRRTLIEKYSAQNVLLGTHGTFAPLPQSARFFAARQSRPSHSGHRALGNLQAAGDADGSFSRGLAKSPERRA